MKRLVCLLHQPQHGQFLPLKSLVLGQPTNWMSRTHIYMGIFKKLFTCFNHLDFMNPPNRHTYTLFVSLFLAWTNPKGIRFATYLTRCKF
ncbi:hypothetical protein HanRHA438_Chr15g0720021 [Helianthus annuus]|nr:hypothetical protein HanRHA438_Chr15g0720021 [Helianthus annuus]